MLHNLLTIKTDILICTKATGFPSLAAEIYFFFRFPPRPPRAKARLLAAATSWMLMAM